MIRLEKTASIPISLYVHIPWCVRKCPYCDFNSHEKSGDLPEQAYIRMLQNDLLHFQDLSGNRPIESIFFGGGTPSLFSAAAVGEIIELADQIYGLSQTCEITLEANPGTFEQQRFRDYHDTGVNRLSIGIQSFSDTALQKLGRIHSSDEASLAVSMARSAGFDNINLDLMFGLPEQDTAAAMQDLQTAVQLEPEHLSWYELTIEPNTAFYSLPPQLPRDDEVASINDTGLELLEKSGYERYEVSAFSRPGKACRHNLNYWQFGDYLGIGAGAHGKLTHPDQETITRTQRNRMPDAYLAAQPTQGYTQRQVIPAEQPFEFLMNALRLVQGVPTQFMARRTSLSEEVVRETLDQLRGKGYIDPSPEFIRPSAKGLRYLNDCLTELLPDDNRINLRAE